jgi:hypothetical protein
MNIAHFELKVKHGFSYFTLGHQSKLKFMNRYVLFFIHKVNNVYKFYTYLDHEQQKLLRSEVLTSKLGEE